MPDDHETVTVKYFTSCTLSYPHDDAAVERQNIYLQAIRAFTDVKVISGFFKKNRVLMPVYEDSCKRCAVPQNGFVRVVRLEEKRSDVNLAVEMMVDTALSDVECLAMVTGDADQVGTIEAVRRRFRKTVVVFNPQNRISDHLKRVASYYKNISRDLPAQCQLPDTISYGKRGDRFIHRPAAWR